MSFKSFLCQNLSAHGCLCLSLVYIEEVGSMDIFGKSRYRNIVGFLFRIETYQSFKESNCLFPHKMPVEISECKTGACMSFYLISKYSLEEIKFICVCVRDNVYISYSNVLKYFTFKYFLLHLFLKC